MSELGSAAARSEIRTAFDEGSALFSYIGHGGIHLWVDENLLNIRDVASLSPQPEQPLLLTMNCLNGYFHFPYFYALSEELLKAKNKGAIAVIAPSGLSRSAAAHRLHLAMVREIFRGDHDRLGDAVFAAVSAFADSGGSAETIAIYHLFGDPALGIR